MQTEIVDSDSALGTAWALWRMQLRHYQQLARSGASSARLAPAARAVLAAARDAQALGGDPAPWRDDQNQE